MLRTKTHRRLEGMAVSLLLAILAFGLVAVSKGRPVAADTHAGIKITGIYDVTIFAPNVQKLAAFYDKLGLSRTINSDKIVVYSMPKQDFVILSASMIATTKKASATPPGMVGVSFFVDNLGPVEDNLRKQGIPFEGPKPLEAYLRGVKIRDPNGNEIHFLVPKS